MLRFITVALALAAVAAGESTPHKVFRVVPESEEQLRVLQNLDSDVEGFTYWKSPSVVSYSADLMVAPEKLDEFQALMKTNEIDYDTYVENVEALLEEERSGNRTRTRAGTFGWHSYHTLQEIYNWLDSLAKLYPENVEVVVGGRTYEGRKIKGVHLRFGESKPGIFIEGGIHAREWISHATVTYLINQLLTSKDVAIRELAESHEWYIFPVFNPDGYVYTHVDPRSMNYRFWRKTRSPNKARIPFSGCYGTDLNRNWEFQWMTAGASQNPCSEAYAGKQPFSEIESQTLSQYITSISGKLFAYVGFHSYSQLLMFPYGHTKNHLDNYDEQLAIGRQAITALAQRYGTAYRTGNIAETIGFASGSTLDWVKSQFKLPMVYIYELRDRGNRGFVLPPQEIIPTGEEIMDSLVAMFKAGRKYGYPSHTMFSTL